MTRDISSYHMMQVTFILRHGSDRNHCMFHQSTVHTAVISKACGQLTEIIVCVFVCFVVVVFYQSIGQPYWKLVDSWLKSSCVFFVVVFLNQSTRQPYWKLVDFWLKSSCVPSVNNPHSGHIESLWIADWNHRVCFFLPSFFLLFFNESSFWVCFLFFCCCFLFLMSQHGSHIECL